VVVLSCALLSVRWRQHGGGVAAASAASIGTSGGACVGAAEALLQVLHFSILQTRPGCFAWRGPDDLSFPGYLA